MPLDGFFFGLTGFTMGLIVLLRGRRDSEIALGRQFHWLGAFALLSSIYSWGLILDPERMTQPFHTATDLLILLSLAASGAALVRFGTGLMAEAGPLPAWLGFLPVALLVPLTLVIAYALVVVFTATDIESSIIQWSRYLLLLPGGIFAALGFARQWARLKQTSIPASSVLLATAIAFLINAIFSGAIARQGVLTESQLTALTGVPIETWRLVTMILVAALVTGSMNVFEVERRQEIERLEAARKEAQKIALSIHARTRQQTEVWLGALVRLGQRIAGMDEADEVLTDVVAWSRESLSAAAAALALYQAKDILSFRVRVTGDERQVVASEMIVDDMLIRAATLGRALRYPEDIGGVLAWPTSGGRFKAETAAIVPLKLNDTVIGILWVGRTDGRRFSCTDLIGLGYLADQAVIALEHASMAARLQSLAVVEERSRIAREMHDSLAQILGYLGLEMQTLEALVKQGDSDAVLDELKDARASIKSAQADVRENILSLRTTLAGDAGLISALKEYVQEFGIQTGIATSIVDETSADLALSPLVETQSVRIVQEALANVRKHAQARHVQVSLLARHGCLDIQIADDGIGMAAHPADHGHFGLQTMCERAESIGGALDVRSAFGQGTTVSLSLPLERAETEQDVTAESIRG